ncbi:hypothetical protein NQZ68_012025 [Dissostichus eleginoides]|nr:hypothetical protein NQZ68_012025 [Dissostichus eleginoides]
MNEKEGQCSNAMEADQCQLGIMRLSPSLRPSLLLYWPAQKATEDSLFVDSRLPNPLRTPLWNY